MGWANDVAGRGPGRQQIRLGGEAEAQEAELADPGTQVAAAFTHLGFPAYFRVELWWAKLFGVVLLLAPASA